MTNGATARLADWVCGVAVPDLPTDVLRHARACLLDALACAGAGAQTQEGIKLAGAMLELESGGPGRLWFLPGTCSSWTEAFVNASLAHALDYDDSHKKSKTHPGAAVHAAALAAARASDADLADLWAGIVAGYEVAMRLGSAVGVAAHRRSGWHATSTCGTVAAAAAAARVYRLDPERMASALGNAATQAAGLWAFTNDGAMSKKFHPGHAARAGLTAAALARRGVTGSRVALEAADGGFFAAFAPQQPESEWRAVLEAIGDPFWLPEVAFKPYPCCRTAHTSIDAALALRAGGLQASDVARAEVHTYRLAVDQCGFNDPRNEVQAAFSTPYLVACALRDGAVRTSHFAPGALDDAELYDLQRRVVVLHDPALDADFPAQWPARLVVTTKHGVVSERRIDVALGDPSAPMSPEQQQDKFLAGAAPLIGSGEAQSLVSRVNGLPLHGSASDLWQALDRTTVRSEEAR